MDLFNSHKILELEKKLLSIEEKLDQVLHYTDAITDTLFQAGLIEEAPCEDCKREGKEL